MVREEGPVDLTVYRVSFLFLDINYKKEECRMFELDPSKFPESPIVPTMIMTESFPQTDQFSEAPTQMFGIPMKYVGELLKGYKVFGPHLETNRDVSLNSEDRYFHLHKKYSFCKENLIIT